MVLDRFLNVITDRDNLQVSKPFKFRGMDYKRGDIFDWRKIDCTWRKVQQLAGQRKLVAMGAVKDVKNISNKTGKSKIGTDVNIDKKSHKNIKKRRAGKD